MKNRLLSPSIVALLMVPPSALAQFEKYKSPTQFEAAPEAPAADSSRPFLENKAVEVPPPPAPDASDDDSSMGDADSFDGESTYGDTSDNEGGAGAGPMGKTDVFGHGSGISGSSTASVGKKDKKYVNLNPETAFGPEVVTSFDFPNVSLIDLTKHMQKLTGINLIMEKDLKGKISIQAPSPITVGDAWKAYLTALNINGYTLVDSGAFYKIVNARDIRYTPTKIYTGSYTPDTENYVMRIIPLKNIDSVEVSRSFRPFLSRYGRMIEIRQTNTIIIQDTGSNINRLTRLLKFLDVPGHDETLQIIPVKYSSAQEIAKLLDQLMKGKTPGKFTTSGSRTGAANNISKLIAEPRTNSIIAMANADGARELRSLIEKLDSRQSSNRNNQIHVYYLNHGDAETLSKTLSALVAGGRGGGANRLTRPAGVPGVGGLDGGDSLFTDDVKITSDKDNNAIVVTASPTDWLTIKGVVTKLDIPRDQVYVEGMIMETQVSRGSAWGVSVVGAYGSGGAQKAGFTGGSNDLSSLLTNNISGLGGLFLGGGTGRKIQFDPGTGKSITINSINALVTAIATTTDSNVLATPQILALDNTEAMFEVGESVPIPKTTISTGAPAQTAIEQQSVTMRLTLTPQINKVTRFIKLKIKQKIEDFSERAVNNAAGGVADTTIRNAETTVVVRDRDTIAMGGLMRDKETSKVNKVPLLGDIPVLGWLFKNKSKSVDKVNLLFFLTPKIMSSYQKTVATTVKDLLNRRAAHLKHTSADDDQFKTTAKGLFDKASKQENGPLYDAEEANRYQNPGEGPAPEVKLDGTAPTEEKAPEKDKNDEPLPDSVYDEELAESEAVAPPNYAAIAQKAKEVKEKAIR